MDKLIETLKEQGVLKTPHIVAAFHAIDRKDFVPQEMQQYGYLNEALPIGSEQTISQPYVVAFMLELLKPREGDRVLDIGSGSAWTSCLLASLVGEKGKVIAIEIIPELCELGKQNAKKYGFEEQGTLQFLCQNGNKGYSTEAPYDKILVSAAVKEKKIPLAWREQLKIRGRIVMPIADSIWMFQKQGLHDFIEEEHKGFAFVPFI